MRHRMLVAATQIRTHSPSTTIAYALPTTLVERGNLPHASRSGTQEGETQQTNTHATCPGKENWCSSSRCITIALVVLTAVQNREGMRKLKGILDCRIKSKATMCAGANGEQRVATRMEGNERSNVQGLNTPLARRRSCRRRRHRARSCPLNHDLCLQWEAFPVRYLQLQRS